MNLKDYRTLTFEEYPAKPENKLILLRRDVDRMPGNALKTAKVKHEFNLKLTYYFRRTKMIPNKIPLAMPGLFT